MSMVDADGSSFFGGLTVHIGWLGLRPPPFNRQHLSSGACLEDKKEANQNCSVCCV